jgi:pilus assembly protein CpaE
VSRRSGQATVEVVGLLPVLVGAALALLEALAAGVAAEYAGHAAEAGAVAISQGRAPREAAADALPSWSRRRLDVAVTGRRVRVTVRPPAIVPGTGSLIAASAEAVAGGPDR